MPQSSFLTHFKVKFAVYSVGYQSIHAVFTRDKVHGLSY